MSTVKGTFFGCKTWKMVTKKLRIATKQTFIAIRIFSVECGVYS